MRKQIKTINESVKDRTAQSVTKDLEKRGYNKSKKQVDRTFSDGFIVKDIFLRSKDLNIDARWQRLKSQEGFYETLKELYGNDVRKSEQMDGMYYLSREVSKTSIDKDNDELRDMGDTLNKRGN